MPEGNPFKPGAGRVPPELAGRSAIIADIARQSAQVLADSEGDRPIVVSGLRGVGKTVLLNEVVRNARASSRWVSIKLEAVRGESLAAALTNAMLTEARQLASTGERFRSGMARVLGALRSFQIRVDPNGNYSFGIDVQPLVGIADSGALDRDLYELLRELGDAARALDMGVLLAVDELQDASVDSLNALNVALHNIGQDPWPQPIMFIGTGLPSLPAVLADATSYAERLYDYRSLGLLDSAETRDALQKPTLVRGVSWDADALALVVTDSGGYPYFVQACGKHVWDSRAIEDRIRIADARSGVLLARNEVDRGLYQSRWDRATPAQRELMRAMAQDDGEPSAIQDLVSRLGRSRTSDLSVARRGLITGGHVYAPDRGFVAFTVPGMADFIERRIGL